MKTIERNFTSIPSFFPLLFLLLFVFDSFRDRNTYFFALFSLLLFFVRVRALDGTAIVFFPLSFWLPYVTLNIHICREKPTQTLQEEQKECYHALGLGLTSLSGTARTKTAFVVSNCLIKN